MRILKAAANKFFEEEDFWKLSSNSLEKLENEEYKGRYLNKLLKTIIFEGKAFTF